MKIRSVSANNRRKAFEVKTYRGTFVFPYVRLERRPTAENRIAQVYVDQELGREECACLRG